MEPKCIIDTRIQLSSYLWDHMTARPDMPGVYGLGVRAKDYVVLWSDASGVIASPCIPWDSDCGMLANYIQSLYISPSRHFTNDPTIEVVDDNNSMMAPNWTIRMKGKTYENCHIIFSGPSWGRRTFVWTVKIDNESVVIKDAYRDDARRFCEGQILEKIHELASMPGMVRLIDWCFVCIKPAVISTAPCLHLGTDNRAVPHRRKIRLVLGSIGRSPRASESVLDLLKAVYDVIEGVYCFHLFIIIPDSSESAVHRFLSIKHNILHRDLSVYNFCMYPQHHKWTQKGPIQNKPMFIDDVLRGSSEYVMLRQTAIAP
jgi:hypothetical protein